MQECIYGWGTIFVEFPDFDDKSNRKDNISRSYKATTQASATGKKRVKSSMYVDHIKLIDATG